MLDEVEPSGAFCADDGPDDRRVKREKGKNDSGEKKDGEVVVDGDGGEGVRVKMVGTTER